MDLLSQGWSPQQSSLVVTGEKGETAPSFSFIISELVQLLISAQHLAQQHTHFPL